jgi:hypothetical protein
MFNDLNLNSEIDISLLILNLFCGFFASILIQLHYRKFASVLTNRDDFSNLFPFLTLIIVLIIYVVKSSLALSLGLVGALSIVRFRTPIKEPEELAYIFICIAAGLGYGANQTIPTSVAVILILLLVYLLKIKKIRNTNKNIFLSIEIEKNDINNTSDFSNIVKKIIENENDNYNLTRIDITENIFQATYILNLKNLEVLENLNKTLQKEFPKIKINFIDQNNVPSI